MRTLIAAITLAFVTNAEPVVFSYASLTWYYQPGSQGVGETITGTGSSSISRTATTPYGSDFPGSYSGSASASVSFGVLKSKAEMTWNNWWGLNSSGWDIPWGTLAVAWLEDQVQIQGPASSYDLVFEFTGSGNAFTDLWGQRIEQGSTLWESLNARFQGGFYLKTSGDGIRSQTAELTLWPYGPGVTRKIRSLGTWNDGESGYQIVEALASVPDVFALTLRGLPANQNFRLRQGTYAGTPAGVCIDWWQRGCFEGPTTGKASIDLGNSAHLRSVKILNPATGKQDGAASLVSQNGFDYVVAPTPVPETSTFALAGLAFAGFVALRLRR